MPQKPTTPQRRAASARVQSPVANVPLTKPKRPAWHWWLGGLIAIVALGGIGNLTKPQPAKQQNVAVIPQNTPTVRVLAKKTATSVTIAQVTKLEPTVLVVLPPTEIPTLAPVPTLAPTIAPTLAPVKKPPTLAPTEPPPVEIPTDVPVSGSGYNGPYDPSGPDRNCSDFSTHAEAQAFFIAAGGPGSDRHKLDGNHDGVACENLP